jgi:hypothetical protein
MNFDKLPDDIIEYIFFINHKSLTDCLNKEFKDDLNELAEDWGGVDEYIMNYYPLFIHDIKIRVY